MKDEGIVGLTGGNSNHNGNHSNGATTNSGLNGQPEPVVTTNGSLNVTSHCTGCRELKREVDDLKRLVSHFIEPRPDVMSVQSQDPRSPPEVTNIQQAAAELSLQHMPSCQSQLLPWLLSNGLSPSSPPHTTLKLFEDAARNTTSQSAFWPLPQTNAVVPTSSSANNQQEMTHAATALSNAIIGQEPSLMDHTAGVEASETSSSASSTNTQQFMIISPQQQLRQNAVLNGGGRSLLESAAAASSSQMNPNLIASLLSMNNPTLQQQLAALVRSSGLVQQQQQLQQQQQQALAQSVPANLSGFQSLHHSLMLASSNAALQQQQQQQREQQLQQSQQQQAQHQAHLQSPRTQQPPRTSYPQPQQIQQVLASQATLNRTNATASNTPTERTPYAERRLHSGFQRAASDDYVRIIRQQDLSEENVQKLQIPVPQALQTDPNFRPLSENQVITQVMQNKKYESVNVAETMAQLCKKLAEKRVFGSRLMAQTTVAAPNHSNYNNLPSSGIIYIQHVCRKVLGGRIDSDEEFWECFREAMRKLAARCRRVRHAKKVRSPKVEDLMGHQLHHPQAFLIKPDPLRHAPTAHDQQQAVAALNMLGMDVDQLNMAELQRSGSPVESQTPLSSPSRNSSTPTPSSSSKPDN